MTHPRSRFFAALLLTALLATGCGEEIDLATAPDPSDDFAILVPRTMAGLTTQLSEKATKRLLRESRARNSYARDVQVFELRRGKELRAAFEVVRMAPDARVDDPTFRKELVSLIGSFGNKPKDIGGVPVFEVVKQNEQYIWVWFEGRFMQALIVRASATQEGQAIGVNKEQLLKEALALTPTKVR